MPPLSTSVCSSCRLRLSLQQQIRSFSISRQHSSIPPESPTYVDVPLSHQPDLLTPRRQKGILPIPRELFPHQRPDKPSAQYIQNLTKDKLAKNRPDEATLPELKKHKNRMTEIRKKHLREGLKELYTRKQSMTRQVAMRSEDKQKQRTILMAQAEREDARLTNVSTPQNMMHKTGTIGFADEKAVYERKLANLAKQDLFGPQKSAARRNALHNLYMNARNFITTEEQLFKAIEEEFPTDGVPREWRNFRSVEEGTNVWNLGPPPGLSTMLKAQRTSTGSGMGSAFGLQRDEHNLHERDQERMKRIAEELSGGKM